MFCKYCGKQIEPNSKFCQYCGQNLDNNNHVGNNINIPNYTNVPNNVSTPNFNQVPNQPIYNNMTNSVPNSKESNPILIMMIVVFIIFAIGIPVAIYLITGGEENLKESEPQQEENVPGPETEPSIPDVETNPTIPELENPTIPEVENPTTPGVEEPNSPNNNGTTATINHDGYNYKIPSKYQHTVYDGHFALFDNSGQWIMMIQIAEGSYTEYKSNISLIDSYLGLEYNNVLSTIKKYNNVEYIETNFIAEGYPAKMVCTSLGSNETAISILMSTTNSTSFSLDNLLKEVFPIITSIEKDDKHVL